MRIGYFTSIEGWGGSEMYLLQLMQGVLKRGHEVVLFGVEGARLWEEAGKAGIERIAWRSIQTKDERLKTEDSHALGLDLAPSGGLEGLQSSVFSLQSRIKRFTLACVPSGIKLIAGNAREVLQLRWLFGTNPVDVMHVNVHGYEVAGVACRMTGIPSVGVFCIVPDDEENRLRRLLIRFSGKVYQHIIGKSCFAAELWQKVLKRDRSDCTPVYNGVDLKRFRPADENKRQSSCLRIVSVGRLDKTKRFDVLIEAIAQMKDIDVFLTVVGDGPERETLKHLAINRRVSPNVVFTGSQDDVFHLLQQADVFCYPSEYDSFGQVLIEAIACGLPLVTSDYGPFSEINLDGETGFIVPAGDANAFAMSLGRLHAEADRRKRFGMAARARAELLFDHDTCVVKMIHVYQQVLNETRSPIHE